MVAVLLRNAGAQERWLHMRRVSHPPSYRQIGLEIANSRSNIGRRQARCSHTEVKSEVRVPNPYHMATHLLWTTLGFGLAVCNIFRAVMIDLWFRGGGIAVHLRSTTGLAPSRDVPG